MSFARRSADPTSRACRHLAKSMLWPLSALLIVLFAGAGEVHAEEDHEALAAAAEEAGFQAIDGARWCDAAEQFLIAYRHVPNSLLLDNGAKAAAEAGDFALAIDIYRKLLNEKGKTLTRKEIRRELKRLGRRLAEEEPKACGFSLKEKLAPPPAPTPQPPTDQTGSAGSTDGTSGSDGTGSQTGSSDEQGAPDEAWDASATGSEQSGGSPMGWLLPTVGAAGLVTGLVAAVVGGSALLYGLQPALQHNATNEQIKQAAENNDLVTAQQLQEEIVVYEEQWKTQGVYFASVGGTALAVGVLVAVAGSGVLVAGLLAPADAE